MAQLTMRIVVERLREVARVESARGGPDGALLEAFIRDRSEAAFAELVRRHGPMVWGVCWRLLPSRQDAEDCYQATFLVLVRKARTVRPRSRVAAWLHGVAYHAALKARQLAAKRRGREMPIDRSPEPFAKSDSNAELRQLLDVGLNELPDKYRIPIVLCELEGRSIKEVAAELGSPIGTVAGWLSRGRSLLVRRLAKHGLTAVALAALFAERSDAAPPMLPTSSASVQALADATGRALLIATVKSWLVTATAVAVIVGSLAWMAHVAADNNNGNAELPRGNGAVLLDTRPHPEPKPNADAANFVVAQKKDEKDLINKKTQKAIDEALAFLKKAQAEDGSFGTGQFQGDVGVTGLAGLAFLSGNHQADGGDFGKAVTKAVRYILSNEDQATPGFYKSAKGFAHGPMYGHGFATLFLADAYPSITDKKLKKDVKESLERAVTVIVKSQNREGGWRYLPRPADADLSVTACQVAALRAARDAGFGVPKETLDNAIKYVKSCQDKNGGGFRYQSFGGGPGFARSAAAMNSLNRLGVIDGNEITKGMDYVRNFEPGKQAEIPAEVAMHYHYGHYYAAKTMWYAGDKDWNKWYPAIRDELLKTQKADHSWQSGTMDSHYCTAVSLIILQMPHGHLPSLKR